MFMRLKYMVLTKEQYDMIESKDPDIIYDIWIIISGFTGRNYKSFI